MQRLTHLSHADSKSTDEIQTCFLAPLLGNRVLQHCVVSCDLSNGGEEEMSAIRNPVDPLQLVVGRDTLQCLVAGVKNRVCWNVFWEVKPGSWNG